MRLFVPILKISAVMVFAGAAFGQFRAGIEGTVLDPSGAAVPSAEITLRNVETASEQRTTTSSLGYYRFYELAPGTYSIVAKKSGFADLTMNEIHVAGESVRGVDLPLRTAQAATSVTVNGDALPDLQSENANVQRSLSST